MDKESATKRKLPTRPRLRSSLLTATVGTENLFLLAENKFSLLEGQIFARLVPLLNGEKTVPELLASVGRDFPIHELFNALQRLSREGCLTDGPSPARDGAFWDHFATDAARRFPSVSVTGLAGQDPSPLVAELAKSGLEVCEKATCGLCSLRIT